MPPQQKNLAVLIVHGAYTDVVTWQNFIWLLACTVHTVKCPQLPSNSREPTSGDVGLREDVEVVQGAIRELISKDQAIVILTHDYGGAVTLDAVTEELYYSSETGVGVKHLIFVSAFLPLPGTNVRESFLRHKTLPKLETSSEGSVIRPVNPTAAFYSDLPTEKAQEVSKENMWQSLKSVEQPVNGCPWKDVDCTYVICDRDQALSAASQKAVVQELRDKGARLDAVHINSGHTPFLSRPDELFAIVRGIIDP